MAATTEDDVDEDKIREKLSKITMDYKLLKGTVNDSSKPKTPTPTPSPIFEKAPVFPAVIAPPPVNTISAPPSPPPPVVEKPKSPAKLVSPFLTNDVVSPATSPSKQNGSVAGGASSHVNKMRAMFNTAPVQPESPTKLGPAKNSKLNQQKALFERAMLGEEVKEPRKPIDIQREIEEAKEQEKLNKPPALEHHEPEIYQHQEPEVQQHHEPEPEYTNGNGMKIPEHEPEIIFESKPLPEPEPVQKQELTQEIVPTEGKTRLKLNELYKTVFSQF